MADYEPGQDLSHLLLMLLSENPDLQTFIDRVTGYLGNPIALVDTHFRILCASANMDLRVPLWKSTMEEHYVSEAIISDMEKNEILDIIMKHKKDVFRLGLPDGYEAIRVPLYYHSECCGFVGIYNYTKDFGDTEPDDLILVGQALTVMYNADPKILGRLDDTRDDYFLELLKCDTQETAQIVTRRNSNISFGSGKVIVCLTRKINGMSSENVAYGRIRDFLDQRLRSHVSAIYDNSLFMLFSLKNVSRENIDSLLNSIQNYCKKYELNAGLSFEFEDDSFIPLACKQARKAALFGEPYRKNMPLVSDYEGFLINDIINSAVRVQRASFYLHPVISKLKEYDREFKTKYLDTLRSYLNSFCNMKATASELGVHYNTIKYRISVMEDICGRDLKYDNELLTILSWSLRIYDFSVQNNIM